MEPAFLEPADACPSCGQKLGTGVLFCTGCGLRLTPQEPAKPAPEQMATPLTELAFEKEPVQEPAPACNPEPAPVCMSCGAALIPNMKFCTVCGAKATPPEPVEPVTAPMSNHWRSLLLKANSTTRVLPRIQPETRTRVMFCGAALAPYEVQYGNAGEVTRTEPGNP
jgi:predicted amidophosphoribosyltransferase